MLQLAQMSSETVLPATHATDVIHALRLETNALEQRIRQGDSFGVSDVYLADSHSTLLSMARLLLSQSGRSHTLFESAQAYTLAMCQLSAHAVRQHEQGTSQCYAIAIMGLGFHARAAEWHFWQGKPLPTSWNDGRLTLVDTLLRADELLLTRHHDEVRISWTADLIRCALLEYAQSQEFTWLERERTTDLVRQLASGLPVRRQSPGEACLRLIAWHGLAHTKIQQRALCPGLNSLLLHGQDIRKKLNQLVAPCGPSLGSPMDKLRNKLLLAWHAHPCATVV